MFFLFGLFLSLFASFTYVNSAEAGSYIDQTLLGENNFSEYSGPLAPSSSVYPSWGQIENSDERFDETFANDVIQDNLFSLSDFWLKESEPQLICPNAVFDNNIGYIHYLYRLVGISYLHEALREYAIAAKQMGVSAPDCSIEWEDSFARCAPKSDDMKRFLRRIKGRHTMGMDLSRMVRLSKSQIAQQLNLFNQHLLSGEMNGIVERRMSSLLPASKPVTLDTFAHRINLACKQDKSIVTNLCSETDFYYGFSDVGIFSYLLQKSNTIAVINEGGYGEGCLKRFAKINAKREDKIDYLSPLSEVLFERIRGGNLRYKQGSLFIAGALKEFDDKGLEEFLYAEKKEPVKDEVVVAPPVVVAVAPGPEPEPEPEIIHEPEPLPKPVPLPVVTPKISQFEMALKRMDDNPKLESVALDMEKFKNDFIFTPLMTEALREPLHDFQTRQGLEDMAYEDKLGTTKEPVQLIFLKFLIDNNFHTGLFNVVAVLGERFYVRNDIDSKTRPVLVELKNDDSTGFRWQITLVRPVVTIPQVADKKTKK